MNLAIKKVINFGKMRLEFLGTMILLPEPMKTSLNSEEGKHYPTVLKHPLVCVERWNPLPRYMAVKIKNGLVCMKQN